MSVSIFISYGEFLDKLTILQIKSERISDKDKLANIEKELAELNSIWHQERKNLDASVEKEMRQLKIINEKLWEIEDAIRDKERNNRFDNEFIELARSVYFTNDKRAEIKKQINQKLGSALIEEKSYSDYGENG